MKVGQIVKRILSILVENGKLSIGRCMLLTVFFLAIVKWSTGVDIPATMLTFMSALLAYVVSGKLLGGISDTVQKVKGIKDTVTNIVNVSDSSKKEETTKKIPDDE
jgi:hypothetical protein